MVDLVPATIGFMIRNKMLCIGCPIGIFHTVADACDADWVDLATFSDEMHLAVVQPSSTMGCSATTAGPDASAFCGHR